MAAERIDGKRIAAEVHAEVRARAQRLREERRVVPGLATVLVGDDAASLSYVTAKQKACADDGIESFGHHLPAGTPEQDVISLVAGLAGDPNVHGILVQLPLPPQIDEERVLQAVPSAKDVDGFHPENLGLLGLKDREPGFTPCTPAGVIELLQRSAITIEGARAVVLGRSQIVGLPVSLLLLRENATVTICHSRTRDLGSVTRQADILVAAIGRPNVVTREMVRPGVVVIDVGTNRIDDPSRKRGWRLVGDCDYEGVSQIARAITPVPGGVGPMTIAMLMKNTLLAAERA